MKLVFNIKGGERNINKILFTEESVDNAINEYKTKILKKQSFGQTFYGKGKDFDSSKASFIINKIEKKDNTYYGVIEILDNEEGKMLKSKINDTCKIGLMMEGDLNSENMVNDFVIHYPIIMTANNRPLNDADK